MFLFKKSINKCEAGAALVEFAIVVPLLLLLAVGIVEFGFAYYHLNILNKSVQDGARFFSDPQQARNGVISSPIDVSTVTNSANIIKTRNLVIYGSTATGAQLLPDAAPNPTVYCAEENTSNVVCLTTTNHIRVTATYSHNFILGNILNNFIGISNPFTLTASSVLRVE